MAADLTVPSAAAATELDYEELEEATPKLLQQSKLSKLPRYRNGSGIPVNGGQSVTITFHGTDSARNPTSHRSSNGNGNGKGVDADESVVDPLNCSVYLDELRGKRALIPSISPVSSYFLHQLLSALLQGKWKCHHCNWTYFVGSSHSAGISNHTKWRCRHCNWDPSSRSWSANHGAPHFSYEIKGAESINGAAQKNGILFNGLNHQSEAILENGKLSASSLTSSNGFVEKQTLKGSYRVGGLDSIVERRKGVTESDVETVLEKQDTHDLYCPGCSSCLTGRVVLNKREQFTLNGDAMLEENKPETRFQPMLDTESAHPADDRGQSIDITAGSSAAVDGSSGEGQPENFRCLSCFKFLIPQVRTRSDPRHGSQTATAEQRGGRSGKGYGQEILKSVVFGGLIESITSLGVVSSAAGANATTLNVLVMGLANVIGGLVIISYNLLDLKRDHYFKATTSDDNNDEAEEDSYQMSLGRRKNFRLHYTVAILSFLVCGLLPTITYGFAFSSNGNDDEKLAAAGGVSLVCIILLAIGKAHAQKQQRKRYGATILYFLCIWMATSGTCYLVGDLIKNLNVLE